MKSRIINCRACGRIHQMHECPAVRADGGTGNGEIEEADITQHSEDQK